MTSARRVYRRPPIDDAVVEFLFRQAPEWDPTIPGRLLVQAPIKQMYAGKPEQQQLMRADAPGPGLPGQLVAETRVKFSDVTGTKILTVGADALSFSSLRPYEGWEQFSRRVADGLSAYEELVGPREVVRVGVRYINRIVIPHVSVELKDYFSLTLNTPDSFPPEMTGFMVQSTQQYDDGSTLQVRHAPVNGPEGSCAFVMDLDVAWNIKSQPVPISAALPIAELLHSREGDAFEAVITDKTRALFDAD
jgi:uncharacterized protein (TIGR04255 family)